MILLTPRIVRNSDDMNSISDDQRIKFGESANKVEAVDVLKEISGK